MGFIYGNNYHLPDHLPGGFWDALGPLAQWILSALRNAYSDGYLSGRVDGAAWAAQERDKKDRRPPSGLAVVTM